MGASARCNTRGVSISLAEAVTASSGNGSRVADWIKEFNKAQVPEDTEVSTAQVEVLVEAIEGVSQAGGSTGGSMKEAFVQGVADLGGRDGVEMETAPMAFAVSTLLEAVLAKANLSDVCRLAVLGRVVAREINNQTWRTCVKARSATFSAVVESFLGGGCGFGDADWFENREAKVLAQKEAGVVLNLCPLDVEDGLAKKLQAKIVDKRDCRAEMERLARDLREARTAHTNAVDDARIAAAVRVEVQNELWIVRQRRRLDRAE